MSRVRVVRVAVTLACVALAFALGASPSAAKKKGKKKPPFGPVVTVSAQGNVADTAGSSSIATATCPPGTSVVGGGFSVAAPTSSDGLLVDRSMRASPQSWTVRANRLD